MDKSITFNPFNLNSCMDYIIANDYNWNQSVDILCKQEMNILSDDLEERKRAFANAKIVIAYYDDFYSRKRKASNTLLSLAEIEGIIDEDDADDMVRKLMKGYEEFKDYKTLYNTSK